MVRFGVLAILVAFLGGIQTAEAATKTFHAKPAAATIAQLLDRRLPNPTTSATAGPETTIPYGWVDFCKRYGGECDVAPLPAAVVELTPAAWREVDKVNRMVNRAVDPVSDMDHWGVVDQWDYPTDGKGDCEDYALLKRKLLMEAGLPRQALLLTVVRDRQGEGHAVLMVKTDRGDYVLDNMSDAIEPWQATGYRFVKRQSQENPNVWLALQGQDVPAVAATK